MVMDDGSDIIASLKNVLPNGERIDRRAAREVSTQMELVLAYASEKLLNLEVLMMQVSDLASDYEILLKSPEENMDSCEKAFQFGILSGYLNSEVKEIESLISGLQLDIMGVCKTLIEGDHQFDDSLLKIEGKLHQAKECFRNSQDQVADLRKQSDKFEKFLALGLSNYEELENGECSPMNSKWKLQTVEQQRHFLLSLEKSLARELEFEKKLSESRYNEEELKIKLQIADQKTYYSEELLEETIMKMFTAEIYAEMLSGKSKEFAREPQNDQLRESDYQCSMFYPESANTEHIIEDLKKSILEMQSRAESAEAHHACLMKANVELNDEVAFLRNNGAEKVNCLERKLKESDMQLEHANASVEAIEEQQKMLYTSLNDMEHLIEDLKGKVSKAENRAESAEAKCTLLNDINVELNEELSFVKGRLESLEASLHQADVEKLATAKEIGNRARLIIELVKKLAFERERFQLQMSVLSTRNKLLTEKCLSLENNLSVKHDKVKKSTYLDNTNSYDETLAETPFSSFQVDASISSTTCEMKLDPQVSKEDGVPNIELVRTIDATELNWKYILMAFIILLLSIPTLFFFQPAR